MSAKAPVLVSDVLPAAKAVVTLNSSASLDDALRCLDAHHISSCPVVDEGGRVMGWIDWAAVIKFLVNFVWESKDVKSMTPRSAAVTRADLQRINAIAASNTIHGVLQASREMTKLKSVLMSSPLYDALVILSKGRQHQVPVEDAAGKLVGVLSQRDVLNYYAADVNRIGAIRMNTLKGLNLGVNHTVSCVRSNDLAIDSFFTVALQGYGGAGIIDADGKLVGNLSVSDLALCKLDFTRLQASVKEFVPARAPVIVAELDTFEHVLTELATNKIRRVYLVSSHGSPSGIVTLTDVCYALVRSMDKPATSAAAAPKKKNAFKSHLEKEASKKGSKHSATTGEKKSKKNKGKK